MQTVAMVLALNENAWLLIFSTPYFKLNLAATVPHVTLQTIISIILICRYLMTPYYV